MGRIKINDLPEKNIEMTDKELKKVFGGTLALTRAGWPSSSLKIFKKPVFMEKNDEGEHIFF